MKLHSCDKDVLLPLRNELLLTFLFSSHYTRLFNYVVCFLLNTLLKYKCVVSDGLVLVLCVSVKGQCSLGRVFTALYIHAFISSIQNHFVLLFVAVIG